MVSIENLVHNDCFDYFSCIHFLSTIYSEYLIYFFYNSYLIYYSQVLQVLTLKLFFLVIHIFGYFYLIQAHLHSSILNLLSRLTSSKLLAICIILSIFLLFQLCAYYVAFCDFFTFVFYICMCTTKWSAKCGLEKVTLEEIPPEPIPPTKTRI